MKKPSSGVVELTRRGDNEGATSPGSLATVVRMGMIRLARQLRRQDPPGLSISLYAALAAVADGEGLTIGELAEVEHLPSSAATRAADRLESAGLVQRRRNQDDRRTVTVAVTKEGRRVLSQHRRKGNAWLADRLGRMTPSERATVAEAFSALEAVLGSEDDASDAAAAAEV